MLAFAGGVLAPGLGFMLTGRLPLAILTAVTGLAVVLVVPIAVVDGMLGSVEKLPSILIVASAAVRFGTAAIAAFLAFRDPPRIYKPYEHLWWAAGFVLVSFAINDGLRTRVASERVAQFGFVTDTSLAPSTETGTMVVITKRGFNPATLQIGDLIAVAPKTTSWAGELPGFARVIALPGSVVEVKENGQLIVDGFPAITRDCPATVPHHGFVCTWERQATTQGERERYTTSTSFARAFPPTSVGKGQLFVLPDDRGRQLKAPAGLVSVTDLLGPITVAQ